MVANFHLETAKRRAVYRAAKLALLNVQARQTIEQTDASARQVEKSLARFAEAMTEELIIPAISRIGADLRSSAPKPNSGELLRGPDRENVDVGRSRS